MSVPQRQKKGCINHLTCVLKVDENFIRRKKRAGNLFTEDLFCAGHCAWYVTNSLPAHSHNCSLRKVFMTVTVP